MAFQRSTGTGLIQAGELHLPSWAGGNTLPGVKKPESETAGEPFVGVEKQVEGAMGELWKIDTLPAPPREVLNHAQLRLLGWRQSSLACFIL